jgi:hypothetical protein
MFVTLPQFGFSVPFTGRWRAIPVKEIWWAVDLGDEDTPCVLLVGRDGMQRSGFLGRAAGRLRRQKLVATIGWRERATVSN